MNLTLTRHIITGFVSLAILHVALATSGAELVVLPATTPAPSTHGPEPSPAPAWLSRVNLGEPGAFPPPRSFQASYRISWSDVDAAHAEVSCTSAPDSNHIVTKITGGTLGLARALYQVDATHTTVADRRTLRAIRLDQTELESRKRKTAHVEFTPTGVERTTEVVNRKADASTPPAPRTRTFHFPGMLDLQSTFLYLRSLPLQTGDTSTLITMTAGNPYLTTVKVLGRGPVTTTAGRYQAIECSVDLSKINKRGELEPHRAFKSALAWLSDDNDRLIVKAEAQVFIGTVSLDLSRVSFPGK